MTNLPEEIVLVIFHYLDPKDLCTMLVLSNLYKNVVEINQNSLWKKFLNNTALTYIKGSYKESFFTTPLTRSKNFMIFHSSDVNYLPYLQKLEITLSQFASRKIDFFKNKAALLKLVTEHPLYAVLILFHADMDIRLSAMINTDLLKQLVKLHPECIEPILNHQNPAILQYINSSLLEIIFQKKPESLEVLRQHTLPAIKDFSEKKFQNTSGPFII